MATLDTLTLESAPTGDDILYLLDDPGAGKLNRRTRLSDITGSASFQAGVFAFVDDDTTLSSDSSVLVPTVHAVKTYVDALSVPANVVETTDADVTGWSFVIDEDDMASDLATKLPTQQSVKAYVDAQVSAGGIQVTDATVAPAGNYWDFVVDEDTMVSDSATKLPTQQSVKAYVDALPTLTTSDLGKVNVTTAGGVTTLDVDSLLSTSDATFTDTAFRIENGSAFAITFSASALTADRTLTVQNISGTIAYTDTTQTISGAQTFSSANNTITGVVSVTTGTISINASTNGLLRIGTMSPTFTAAATYITSAPGASWTVNWATGSAPEVLKVDPYIAFLQSVGASALHRGMHFASTYANDPGGAYNLSSGATTAVGRMFSDETIVSADTTSIFVGGWTSFRAARTFQRASGGTITDGTESGFVAQPTISTGVTLTTVTGFSANTVLTGTVGNVRGYISNGPTGGTVTTAWTGYLVGAPTGGTIPTAIGVDVPAFTAGTITTAIGLRVGTPTAGGTTNYTVHLTGTAGTAATGITFGAPDGAPIVNLYRSAANVLKTDASFLVGAALKQTQGADVASANNLVLGNDGNLFEITGTTQVNLLSNVGWQNGQVVTLMFTSTVTVKHGQTTSTTNIRIDLAGAVDFAATASDTLTLCLGEIGGVQRWREVARAVI